MKFSHTIPVVKITNIKTKFSKADSFFSMILLFFSSNDLLTKLCWKKFYDDTRGQKIYFPLSKAQWDDFENVSQSF